MNQTRWCDFYELEKTVISQFHAGSYSVHGPAHWRRVEQNGLWLSARTGADALVTRLFAWFHDSKRENEGTDPDHGHRGAQFAASLRGSIFELEDPAFKLLYEACQWHTDRDLSDDATIGTCWDADRLDLGRVGLIPSGKLMSTAFGRQVAEAGSFYTFVTSDVQRLLDMLDGALNGYAREYEGFPSGDTKEIVEKLLGKNPRGIVFIEFSPHYYNPSQGVLIDPWNEPILIQISSLIKPHYEIRSAGPGRIMQDTDDFYIKVENGVGYRSPNLGAPPDPWL